MRSLIPRLSKDRSGASLVEFTLFAPMLLALMVGLAEFGGALRQHHVMAKGVRDAARYMSRVEPGGCPPTSAAWAAAEPRAQNLAITGRLTGGAALLPDWNDPSTVSISVTCIDNSGEVWRGDDDIAVVEVSAAAPYAGIGALGFLGFGPLNISASHTQMNVGS